ncbi:putative cuticle protein, partial [Operophtera brumata]
AAYPGIIHDEGPQVEEKLDHHEIIGETGHHHQIEHDHAKSHQSIKFEHFHPVPVYVKKEHSHLLKHPLEKGKSEQNLKLIHPEAQHSHGGGLVLEDDRHNTEHLLAGLEHGGYEQQGYEHSGGFEGYEGGEVKLQPEYQGHYYAQHEQALGDSGEGSYKYESY